MTSFRTFLTTARPLYIDGELKVNFTVDELVKFVEDYMKDNQPIVTVEMHEPNAILIGEPFRNTQDNHLKTNG